MWGCGMRGHGTWGCGDAGMWKHWNRIFCFPFSVKYRKIYLGVSFSAVARVWLQKEENDLGFSCSSNGPIGCFHSIMGFPLNLFFPLFSFLYVTLFGKMRLNKKSVAPFFRYN